ncbi:MAG: Rrf2 family transcriptional regulator [Phaeodactylibacter sp.]|nr:Rrf2 family transcriptional regulator [Phaeodactylibacter sp.]MCB9303860.1 Rrf2 family transcriptional regulator [Lewinellaceae bacterium]HQU59205.1 Rrf2 family transcriptional regulator [Saprospiraceae bacterium]
MKISAQDEYGLRILLRIARSDSEDGLSIPQLSELEGLSASYVAKLTRTLRLASFIQSTRGQKGGYILSRPAEEIRINDVLVALGGALFDESFCEGHSGAFRICTNSVDCSVRSLWRVVQRAVDQVLNQVSLADLMASEGLSNLALQRVMEHLNRVAELEVD